MSDYLTFPSKLVAENATLPFDFASRLAAGETISTKSVAATVYTGTDASPSSIVSGSASSSGSIVSQLITAGTAGVIYLLTCTITTNAGQTLQLVGYLAVL